MAIARILVLANSHKHHYRCIAGRSIQVRDGSQEWGPWIRPVSKHDEGAIAVSECDCGGGRLPQPLDIIDVPLQRREESATQPENWFIQPGIQWRHIDSLGASAAPQLEEKPPSLWLQPGKKSDRVTEAFLLTSDSHQSLYLIRPQSVSIRSWKETWDGKESWKRRIRFTYQGEEYDLSLTDPIAVSRYCATAQECEPRCGDRCLLCVSLTPEFQGYHYKVVAGLIELN